MQVKYRNLMFEVAFFSLKVVKLVFVSSLSDCINLSCTIAESFMFAK